MKNRLRLSQNVPSSMVKYRITIADDDAHELWDDAFQYACPRELLPLIRDEVAQVTTRDKNVVQWIEDRCPDVFQIEELV